MLRLAGLLIIGVFGTQERRYSGSQDKTVRRASLLQNDKRCMATYSWNHFYWTRDDPTFLNFFRTPEAREYNCGDVYLNVADASNLGQLAVPHKLAAFIKEFRKVSGNTARVYLFYAHGGGDDRKWAPDFVRVFREFIHYYGSPELGPLGISFNVQLPRPLWLKIFDETDYMKKEYQHLDLAVDVVLNTGEPDRILVDKVMYRSDHVTVNTPRNTYSDLVERFTYFLTKTCPQCNTKYYCNYKAKITFLAEGDCTSRPLCGKLSMCARFTDRPEDPNGGILYAFDQLKPATDFVNGNILPSYRYHHLFDHYGTRYGINFFEWSRCFYGSKIWRDVGLPECSSQYYTLSQKCKAL